LQHSQYL